MKIITDITESTIYQKDTEFEFDFLREQSTQYIERMVNNTLTLVRYKDKDRVPPTATMSQPSQSTHARPSANSSNGPAPQQVDPNGTNNPRQDIPNPNPNPSHELDELKDQLRESLKLQHSILETSKNALGRGRDTTPRRRPSYYHDQPPRKWSRSRSRSPSSYSNQSQPRNNYHNRRPMRPYNNQRGRGGNRQDYANRSHPRQRPPPPSRENL